jgi:prepilin-type N-terminal cleavage/methylation domain-containing protein
MKKNQSAFSLVEILVTLLILSIGVVGTSKMLTQSVANYKTAELRERVTILIWSIADYLRSYPNVLELTKSIQEWQKQLATEVPGGLLTIRGMPVSGSLEQSKKLDVYTIVVQSSVIRKIELEVLSPRH